MPEALDLRNVEHLRLRLDPVRRDRNPAGRWLVAQAAVRTVMVVGVQECRQRGGALTVAGVGAYVEPLFCRDAAKISQTRKYVSYDHESLRY